MISKLSEDASRQEIETVLDKNMFVEAGAGAGKTWLIVKRIINMLKNGYAPGEIVVITFTNAAAEELRSRLSKEIRDNGLTDALKSFDDMNISTIHSFCNVLLHEKAMGAGLPIDIKLISEGEDFALKRKALNRYLKELISDDWEKLENYYPENKTREQIRSRLEGIYLNLLKYPDDINTVLPEKEDLDTAEELFNKYFYRTDDKEYEERLKEIAKKVLLITATITDQIRNYDEFMASKLFSQEANTFVEKIKNRDKENCDIYLINLAVKGKGKLWKKSGLPKTYKAENVDSANEAWQKYLKEVYSDLFGCGFFQNAKDLKGFVNNIWFTHLTEHALKAAQVYRSMRPAGLISNDRLLFETKKLICDAGDTDSLEFFASKYRTFFVDEFQDTDRIQADFIYRLASDPDDMTHMKLRDGSLFVVGDPKQSIYRFRGAEPEVFFDIKERMQGQDNAYVYELHRNYRTNEKLLDWINTKFAPFPTMSAVKKAAADSPLLISGAYRYLNPSDYGGEYTVEQDVMDAADLIEKLINGGYMITDYSDDGSTLTRKIRPSDILLITHKKKGMSPYLEELKKRGIPVYFDGETDLKNDPVLNVFARIYKYLMNPREAFYRVGAEEALRETGVATTESDLEYYGDGLLDVLRDKTRGMTAYGIAEYLLNRLSLVLKKDSAFSPEILNSSLSHLNQMIEHIFENVTGTGSSIISAMEDYMDSHLEHELSLTRKPDAVRFMNLHKTKGLEGRIVIIAFRVKLKWSEKISDIKKGNDYYPGYHEPEDSPKKYYKEYWSSAIDRADIKNGFIADSKEEFHRFEYVAATRAEQAVIFMNKINGECLFSTDDFDFNLDELPSVDYIMRSAIDDKDDDGTVVSLAASGPVFPVTGYEKGRKNTVYTKNSPSMMELPNEKCIKREDAISASYAESGEYLSENEPGMKRPAGIVPGNVLHRTMELLIERSAALSSVGNRAGLIDICVGQALRDYRDDIEKAEDYTAEELKKFISACAAAYLKWIEDEKILENAEEIHTELPFSYFEEKTGTEGTSKEFMKGNADLIIKYPDHVLILDYKSDNDSVINEEYMPEVLKEKYEPQLKLYSHMIEKLYKVDKERIALGIISFSQKDVSGEFLKGESVRVRYTEIV